METMNNTEQNLVKKKSFLNYINIFRGLAIILIIMGHTMQFGESDSLAHIINCEIICGGTALFIFISGFLFQHLSSKFEYGNYLSKKKTNVIFPYLFTSIPGILFCLFMPVSYKNTFAGINEFLQIPMLLSVGRVHNIPTWFIPMIVIFFIFSWLFLKLEKKNLLYKTLPFLFLITIFLQRGVAEYENLINLSYAQRYIAYVQYIISGFVHFLSLYIFGMYCSAHKEIIDKFHEKRFLLWLLMLTASIADIILTIKYHYTNYTISKTFLTMLLLGYLKYYDEKIQSNEKLNKILDITAKYSFGLFFVHWYWLFIYKLLLNTPNVTPIVNDNYLLTILIVFIRFLFVTIFSFLTLYFGKKIILAINKSANTRMFLGI